MQYLQVNNLEKYHPNYKDRSLIWCKIYFSMINGDPEFELLEELDQWRFVKFVMLQLQTKKPVPIDNEYLSRKGFNNKKRSILLTIQMLHNFVEVRNDSVTSSTLLYSTLEDRGVGKETNEDAKKSFSEYVFMTQGQYDQLASKLGKTVLDEYVERLNNYIGSKGKKYKSHYHTILSWTAKDGGKKPTEVKPVIRNNEVLDKMKQWEKERQEIKTS